MEYQTLKVRFEEQVCYVQIYRPDFNNTINERLVAEFNDVLSLCEESASIVVLEGLPEVFCFGGDFHEIQQKAANGQPAVTDPEPLYNLWLQFAAGPFITISHVRGKANAGGIGFVAASDIVISDKTALFSLSELLFGLFPACVLPFLISRIGYQKANYMTLMNQPFSAEQAADWGLVDAVDSNSKVLLRKHLLRLRRIQKPAIIRYKNFMRKNREILDKSKDLSIEANKEVFSDPHNLSLIRRFIEEGKYPWEK